jgi:hypothetical protein
MIVAVAVVDDRLGGAGVDVGGVVDEQSLSIARVPTASGLPSVTRAATSTSETAGAESSTCAQPVRTTRATKVVRIMVDPPEKAGESVD